MDNNELSKNLAEVGTDCISRQAAIDALDGYMEKLCIHIATPNDTESYSYARGLLVGVINDIKQLPPIQPDIVRCKDCKHFESEYGYCDYYQWNMTGSDFCSKAEKREVTT